MNYKSAQSEVDAEVIGCGILTCMAIVSLTILLSYMVEGREAVQGTILDVAFCFIAAALLITAGGGQTLYCRYDTFYDLTPIGER